MIFLSSVFYFIFKYDDGNGVAPFGNNEKITEGLSYYGYALAGLLVGLGAKLGNGCTSGHGVCGIPRFSIRSIVAIMLFMIFAIGISTG